MIVFLDIDGVLNKSSQWRTLGRLDSECLDNFTRCFGGMNLKIVLVSTWRKGFVARNHPGNSPQIKNLESELAMRGMQLTGVLNYDGDRGDAIKSFVANHPSEYVVLDDDLKEYGGRMIEHLYLVDSNTGFSKSDVRAIQKKIKQ